MPKPNANNGTKTSFENLLLKNNNVGSHPQLLEKLSAYIDEIASGYAPPEEVIGALLTFDPSDPAVQVALSDLQDLMQELGLTLAITSNGGSDTAAITIDENTSLVTSVMATDPQDDPVTYAIDGGADAALFLIDPVTGALTFASAPNFETPADTGGDNIYDVTVTATDTVSGQIDSQSIAITVEDVVEGPPIDTSVILTIGNDIFWGEALNTRIDGLDGHDAIAGDAYHIFDGRSASPVREMGDDLLNGDAGRDSIYGDAYRIEAYRPWFNEPVFDAGDDYINGGTGNDFLRGDAEILSGNNSAGKVTFNGGDDVMNGGSGADNMVGDVRSTSFYRHGYDTFEINGGNDVMNGGDDGDIIYGDLLFVSGSLVRGGSLAVNNGDDIINGGAGNDTMYGDTQLYYAAATVTNGADTFVFNDNSGTDSIRDFQRGLDTVEVDGYGIDNFSQLTIVESGGSSTVHFDATNSVLVSGITGLDASDFLFS